MTTYAERQRPELIRRHNWLVQQMTSYPPDGDFADQLMIAIFQTGCLALQSAIAHVCPEQPEQHVGTPLGQYHCPWCGCMCMARVTHTHEDGCQLGLNECPEDGPQSTVAHDPSTSTPEAPGPPIVLQPPPEGVAELAAGAPETKHTPEAGRRRLSAALGRDLPEITEHDKRTAREALDTAVEQFRADALDGIPVLVTADDNTFDGIPVLTPCANVQHHNPLWDGILNHVCPEPRAARYDGPCHDPQHGDNTWDHDCPAPPGDYRVVNGTTFLTNEIG